LQGALRGEDEDGIGAYPLFEQEAHPFHADRGLARPGRAAQKAFGVQPKMSRLTLESGKRWHA